MKKKLPRVIVWASEAAHEPGVSAEQRQDVDQPLKLHELLRGSAESWESPSTGNIIDMVPKLEPHAGIADETPPQPPTVPDVSVTRRRWRARAIVERHANYSAVGGIIPLPIAGFAAVTAIIVRMVKTLSNHYHVPFERERTRAVTIALLGGAAPTGLAAITSSALLYVVPGSSLIGLAVSSIGASSCTRTIGRAFVEHFESGGTLANFPVIELG